MKAELAHEMALAARAGGVFKMEPGLAFAPQKAMRWEHASADRAYERGQRALDSRKWDEALDHFSQAAGAVSRPRSPLESADLLA